MATLKLVAAFLQQAARQGSRSTILRPLGWLIAILAALLTVTIRLDAAEWMKASITTLVCSSVVLYLCAYVYCLLNDKEALRSEKYAIQKLAIKKGFIGESGAGLVEGDADSQEEGFAQKVKQ